MPTRCGLPLCLAGIDVTSKTKATSVAGPRILKRRESPSVQQPSAPPSLEGWPSQAASNGQWSKEMKLGVAEQSCIGEPGHVSLLEVAAGEGPCELRAWSFRNSCNSHGAMFQQLRARQEEDLGQATCHSGLNLEGAPLSVERVANEHEPEHIGRTLDDAEQDAIVARHRQDLNRQMLQLDRLRERLHSILQSWPTAPDLGAPSLPASPPHHSRQAIDIICAGIADCRAKWEATLQTHGAKAA